MSTGPAHPARDSVLRLCDGSAHRVLRSRPVGVSRRARDVALTLQTLAELFFRLPYMLAENVPPRRLVAAEVAHGTVRRLVMAAPDDRRRR